MIVASVSSGIHAIWPNRKRRHAFFTLPDFYTVVDVQYIILYNCSRGQMLWMDDGVLFCIHSLCVCVFVCLSVCLCTVCTNFTVIIRYDVFVIWVSLCVDDVEQCRGELWIHSDAQVKHSGQLMLSQFHPSFLFTNFTLYKAAEKSNVRFWKPLPCFCMHRWHHHMSVASPHCDIHATCNTAAISACY